MIPLLKYCAFKKTMWKCVSSLFQSYIITAFNQTGSGVLQSLCLGLTRILHMKTALLSPFQRKLKQFAHVPIFTKFQNPDLRQVWLIQTYSFTLWLATCTLLVFLSNSIALTYATKGKVRKSKRVSFLCCWKPLYHEKVHPS